MATRTPATKSSQRILAAIASYGSGNDSFLRRMLSEFRSMSFDIDIVIISNIEKDIGPQIKTIVGLPNKNPWSLPFAHKKLFADNVKDYDLFIYSEDDILITEANVRAFLEATPVLREDEVAGFFRVEKGPGGTVSYPEAHSHHHWVTTSVRKRGVYTLAEFTNEHAACYMLTQAQLRKAINSGGFDVAPHEEKYDLLCTAATDPYTQCGLTKLIPVSHIDDFTVHHMSNKYVGRIGVDGSELRRQLEALQQIERAEATAINLIQAETRLWRGLYSKDYYEPAQPEVISLIPKVARSVLSIGCGRGATEIALAESGLTVTAVPLDTVICRGAAAAGVEIIDGDFQSARGRLEGRRFDCVLLLNLLHLAPDPVEVLSSFGELLSRAAPIIIRSPNMLNLLAIWRQIRDRQIEMPRSYATSGAHFVFQGSVEKWCRRAGLTVEQTTDLLHRRVEAYDSVIPALARRALASEFIAVARRA
jgi:2-polyprenyl-3-methyl-5-hydroxy-6-metoxy-1,4-benzoquinol methylase